ncbi:MAG: hypothetical protein GC164_09370 [Phycisphaera sp.]|nr:hypothetical protein [Phycisphaera sp.]
MTRKRTMIVASALTLAGLTLGYANPALAGGTHRPSQPTSPVVVVNNSHNDRGQDARRNDNRSDRGHDERRDNFSSGRYDRDRHDNAQPDYRGRDDRDNRSSFSFSLILGGDRSRIGVGYSSAPCGHYELRTEQVLVTPGYYRDIWVPERTRTVFDQCGRAYTIVVEPGHCERVWVEPVYECRTTRVWVCD